MKEIYYNAKVYTGEDTLCEAFLVENGLFQAVGSDKEMLALADMGTVCRNMKGAFIAPGFNDSHMHLLGLGQSLHAAQLAQHTDSLAGMLDYVREFAEKNPPREGRFLQGRGWNQDYFTDVHRMPSRWDLDSISTDYPIMLTRACGHCCVVNSRVLAMAGISASTISPEGGRIGMENGEIDGRLYDNAISLVTRLIPPPDKEELKQYIHLACRALNTYGITSSQSDDYSTFRNVPFETINEAYCDLEECGELTVRVYEQANFTTLEDLQRFIETGNVKGARGGRFKLGPLKMLGDGSLGSRTAHLSRPYADDPSTSGFSLFSADEMNEMVEYAHRHGMQVAIHAIGDQCLDQVLNAIERAVAAYPRKDHRHGIVHCQISRKDQLERIRELELHVYAQSIFLDYDNHIVESRVGRELAETSYSWKTLMKGGVSVSNGSDAPVELPDVMRGIECAVTRTSLDGTGPYLPEEAFTVAEALDSFTIRGAEASFEEHVKGRIARGYMADFVVLGANPFEVDPKTLHEIPVMACYLEGERVFAKG
ncbi:MAG: amidohydrolase [Firmicutes bacterium]|nr:amidohydrolase [Bacillota bacterium]